MLHPNNRKSSGYWGSRMAADNEQPFSGYRSCRGEICDGYDPWGITKVHVQKSYGFRDGDRGFAIGKLGRAR